MSSMISFEVVTPAGTTIVGAAEVEPETFTPNVSTEPAD
jgi:pyrroline-5-carboxylate reductase